MARSISQSDLVARIGRPDAPVIVDVRTDEDFQADPRLLPRAVRCRHLEVGALDLAGPVVAVCQKGRKLSEIAASWLSDDGVDAALLVGGTDGWTGPALAASRLPEPGLWIVPDTVAGRVVQWAVARFAPLGHRAIRVRAAEVDAGAEASGARAVQDLAAFLEVTGLRSDALDAVAVSDPALDRLLSGAAAVSAATVFAVLDAAHAAAAR